MQLVVDERNQPFEGEFVAFAPHAEETGDVAAGRRDRSESI